eukprot:Hpha_TRINITY_DN11457_c0_g2::TRINITY_DN11457_c0_g2_i1::g.137653::m.137653
MKKVLRNPTKLFKSSGLCLEEKLELDKNFPTDGFLSAALCIRHLEGEKVLERDAARTGFETVRLLLEHDVQGRFQVKENPDLDGDYLIRVLYWHNNEIDIEMEPEIVIDKEDDVRIKLDPEKHYIQLQRDPSVYERVEGPWGQWKNTMPRVLVSSMTNVSHLEKRKQNGFEVGGPGSILLVLNERDVLNDIQEYEGRDVTEKVTEKQPRIFCVIDVASALESGWVFHRTCKVGNMGQQTSLYLVHPEANPPELRNPKREKVEEGGVKTDTRREDTTYFPWEFVKETWRWNPTLKVFIRHEENVDEERTSDAQEPTTEGGCTEEGGDGRGDAKEVGSR